MENISIAKYFIFNVIELEGSIHRMLCVYRSLIKSSVNLSLFVWQNRIFVFDFSIWQGTPLLTRRLNRSSSKHYFDIVFFFPVLKSVFLQLFGNIWMAWLDVYVLIMVVWNFFLYEVTQWLLYIVCLCLCFYLSENVHANLSFDANFDSL